MFKPIKITEYNLKGKLPNPFVFDNGSPVECAGDWEARRREIYKSAIDLQLGGRKSYIIGSVHILGHL